VIERDAYEVLQVHPKANQLVIQAAYRVLAGQYHPDRDPLPGANRRMADLNAAYEAVRTVERRELYDKQRMLERTAVPIVTPYATPAAATEADDPDSNVVDFGRYAGWTLEQLRRVDPEYLRWLGRHSSGIRYRRRIQELLKNDANSPSSMAGRFR
jgi:curved DNA-binding protein CbpA